MDTLALVFTYNEAQNIRNIIDKVLNCGVKDIEILVVDDTSPDGTWRIVQELAKENKRIHLLLRKNKEGRGAAGIDGFKNAVKMEPRFIVEMDADGSHNPKYIKEFRKQIEI